MRVLAIETSGTAGSVAALLDDNLLCQLELDHATKSARSLLPAIDALWKKVAWEPAQVELIAVGIGPGSFTGLRVGVTAAKMLAYLTRSHIMGVNTLAAIAEGLPDGVRVASAAIDAQRGEVAARLFRRDDAGRLTAAGPEELLSVDAWLSGLPEDAAIAGPIVGKLLERLPPGVSCVDREFWNPTAASVGRLAWREYQAGRRDDVWKLAPHYIRRAAAEEKRQK